MKPAVLLISPGVIRPTDQDFGLPHLVSLGGYVREHTGARVEILDLGYEGGDHRALAATLATLGPFLLIGVSVYSSFDYRRCMALGRFLKDLYPDVPLVGGGYHASALPGDVVYEGSPFDAVVVGEGERPLRAIVEGLLGGAPIRPGQHGPDQIGDLDTLPPMQWDLLNRYRAHATSLGRKLQVVLARGCTYHCTFCMERAKSGYSWRPYSPERAVDELKRADAFTPLGQWVVNIADPLFGFQRRWRRSVLEAIPKAGLAPRQFWTLTRSDDLDEEDVALLAAARFSIGIGLESGSPEMLRIMQKGNHPEAYLTAALRLARLSRAHGLSWAANLIIGHPGETPESMRQTYEFARELYLSAPETAGWLSVDPFRLYPGAHVHEQMQDWERRFGARFHAPGWWRHWTDGPLRAQWVDPSASLDFEARARFMYGHYGALVAEIQQRFRGQGRDIDTVFRRSLDEQREQLSPRSLEPLLAGIRRLASAQRADEAAPTYERGPLGLQVRDPWVSRREAAVRRLLEAGALRSAPIIDALLEVGPERYMPMEAAGALLDGGAMNPEREGLLAFSTPLGALATGLEALGLGPGDRAADLAARCGYTAALLAALVGADGEVVAVGRAEPAAVTSVERRPDAPWVLQGSFDGLWLGAAVPRWPRELSALLRPGGRAVTAIGPRFAGQDWVVLTASASGLDERGLGRVRLPVLGGRGGWVPAPPAPEDLPSLRFAFWPGPAAAMAVFAGADLGADAASCFDAARGPAPWSRALAEAWRDAPGRLSLVALCLQHERVGSLLDALSSPPPALRDPAGRALCARFAEALRAADPGLPSPPSERLSADLAHLRATLWERTGAIPPLLVLDCPALGRAGRATTLHGERHVAVSLAQPHEHVVLQILHEDMHALVDPHVDLTGRDTRADQPGFSVHAELEGMVLAATEAWLRSRAPGWIPAFGRWMAGLGAG